MAQLVEQTYASRGQTPPIAADRIASAFIAMDIGLALQHHVDPGAVPLDVYADVGGRVRPVVKTDRLPFCVPWPSRSRSSRTRARTSAARSTS